jgi:hypothetical protein
VLKQLSLQRLEAQKSGRHSRRPIATFLSKTLSARPIHGAGMCHTGLFAQRMFVRFATGKRTTRVSSRSAASGHGTKP